MPTTKHNRRGASSCWNRKRSSQLEPESVGKSSFEQERAELSLLSSQRSSGETEMRRLSRGSFSGSNKCSLLVSIALPLLFVFLLPSLKLEQTTHPPESICARCKSQPLEGLPIGPLRGKESAAFGLEGAQLGRGLKRRRLAFPASSSSSSSSSASSSLQMLGELLLALLRLPIHRFRLSSGLAIVSAKEISSKLDLQEEETHMMMLAPPAEHRSLGPPVASAYQQQQHSAPMSARSAQRAAELAHVYQPEPAQHLGAAAHQALDSSMHAAPALEYPGAANEASSAMEAAGGVGSVEAGEATGGQGSVSGASTGLQARSDLPSVRALNVKCEKNHMTVNVVFDRPFFGLVFSKGHYNDQKCVHLPANSGQTSVNFDIHLGKCGMSSSEAAATGLQQAASQQQPNGLYIENTIIIQYDPQVQEIYDQARKLRCTWYDYYEKSVTFRPYNVDMLDAVTANFLGDNIQCWMQIQVGKGPWSSEVAGIVKIGQTMTMVLAIKDEENKFDMLVRNCVAHDGKHQPIQLVDEYGCVARPKIMAKFQKVRNFGSAATVVSYAHFQAFKFPDSMSVHFQCVIQVCRYDCPEPVCGNQQGGAELAPPSGHATDYASSGSEIVASKEALLPSVASQSGHNTGYFAPNHSLHSGHPNLRVDQSQGRVQVKVDTSMLASMGRAQMASGSGGPLPPHLLHASSQAGELAPRAQQPTGASYATPGGRGSHTYMSSAYFKPQADELPVSGGQQPGGATNGRPSLLVGRSPAASAPQSQVHYSSPYPHQQQQQQQQHQQQAPPRSVAAYATNRLGELASERPELEPFLDADSVGRANPLSLIAAPRALRMAPANGSSTQRPPYAANHRYRRSMGTQEEQQRQQRKSLDASKDSTAVRTQKTIQVVSSDDVAFSLISDSMGGEQQMAPIRVTTGSQAKQAAQVNDELKSEVCFSAAKLMLAVLVTLVVVATSIVIVAFVILRQRAKLDERHLSAVYEIEATSPACSASPTDPLAPRQKRPPPPPLGQFGAQQYFGRAKSRPLGSQKQEELLACRQQEELEHRNNYLARLYSQFVPATYWR